MKNHNHHIYKWYQRLFEGLLSNDQDMVNSSYDAILFRRSEAVPYLCTKYLYSSTQKTEDIIMRFFCLQLLCFSETRDAMHILLLGLNDKNPYIRQEAKYMMEDLGLRASH